MKKRIISGSLVILSLSLMFGFVIAGGHYELSEEAIGVQTSNGVLDLPDGTNLGGDPTNYIILDETREFETTTGTQTITNGTKIDCDFDPGQPDPCGN